MTDTPAVVDGEAGAPAPVTHLAQWAAMKATSGGLMTCECGSQWFRATVAIEDHAPTSMACAGVVCLECEHVYDLSPAEEPS